MGKKIGLIQICYLALTAALESSFASALTLVQSSEEVGEPLTTQSVWKADSDDKNPHLTHWILERRLGLRGLTASANADSGSKSFRVHLDAVLAKTLMHRRSPLELTTQSIPCVAERGGYFNEKGTHWVLQRAKAKWESMVANAMPALELKLEKIRALSEVQALQVADYAFLEWSQSLHSTWDTVTRPRLLQEEWDFYRKELNQKGECPTQKDFWKSRVAQPDSAPVRTLVARAPARLWDRDMTIRVTLHLFDQRLNGVFLVDPTSEISLIHPDFLQRQGIETDWLVTRGILPQSVSFRGDPRMAQPVIVSQTEVGGTPLDHWQYWLTDTEIFSPPQYRAACCDGVIGLDVLRKFAVTFDPSHPAALQFWKRDRFSLGATVQWQPVRIESPLAWQKWVWTEKPSTLDLSNGRWWFPQGDQLPAASTNKTGLTVTYQDVNQERSLRVQSVKSGSAAWSLRRAGLKPGLEITQINGVHTTDLDQWQVDQILAGKKGQTVMLEWATAEGPRIAPLLMSK